MEIRQLACQEYQGKQYHITDSSCGYYDIERRENRFSFAYREFPQSKEIELSDTILSAWLEEPVLFGAFEGGELVGLVEGFLEQWNNRYRISNLCVFEERHRHCGANPVLSDLHIHQNAGCKPRLLKEFRFLVPRSVQILRIVVTDCQLIIIESQDIGTVIVIQRRKGCIGAAAKRSSPVTFGLRPGQIRPWRVKASQ